MSFENVYFNFFSVGSLIATLMLAFGGLFLLTIKKKSGATFHLGLGFLLLAFFSGAYFWAGSIYDESAAFHRWITIGVVFPTSLHVTQFFFHFPRLTHPRLAKTVLIIQYIVGILFSLYFFSETAFAPKFYQFEGHFWDFNRATANMRTGYMVIIFILVFGLVGIWRTVVTSSPDRWAVLGMLVSFMVITVIPGLLNPLSREGAIGRDTYITLWDLLVVLGTFSLLVIYINNTKDRSSFMDKIIGISLVVVLLIMQFLSVFLIKERENSYDAVHSEMSSRILLDDSQPPDLKYRVRYSLYDDSFEFSDNKDTELNFSDYRTEFLNKAVIDEIENLPDENFEHALKKILSRSHASFAGYAGAIEEISAKIPAGQTNRGKIIVENLNDLKYTIIYRYNKISKLPDEGFREKLTKFLSGSGDSFRPFRRALEEQLRTSNSQGAALKTEALELLSVIQPSGTRHYRRDAANAYTAFMKADLKNGFVYEIGYSYRAYRQFIHPTGLTLILMLVVVLIIVLVGFRFFFSGALINPLDSLLEGVRRVNEGDLSVNVSVKVEDEIGFLSRSFNSMVSSISDANKKLQDYADNLEEKVRLRTDELQKAYDKLKELDTLKTNFFANVSHELRTPLTLILSPLESMIQKEAGSLSESQATLISSMHKNGIRLLKLINNLLDFSKLEARQMKMKYREIDLAAFVKELTSSFESAVKKSGLEMKVDVPDGKMPVLFDEEKMEKIVMNLLSNAFKFTSNGGIYISLNESNGIVNLQVRDTGIGIPEDKLESVFERFSQADQSASRKYEGTGIGLALAKEFTHLHKGTIAVESVVGEGTIFNVRFPRVPQELTVAGLQTQKSNNESNESGESGESTTRRSSSRSALLMEMEDRAEKSFVMTDETGDYEIIEDKGDIHRSVQTVLIVEDNHDMRKFLYFLLKPYFRLLTAENGKLGLEKTITRKPDLILSDVMMPEMSGYDLLTALKKDEELKHIPIILLTAKADALMKAEGLESGADDYLAKPFNSRELLARIRTQLRLRKLQKEIMIMRDQLLEMNEKLNGQLQVNISELLRASQFRQYLPPQLVNAILSKEQTAMVESRRKKLTIFFSDVVEFTRLTSELDPEDLSRILNHYLSEMTAIVNNHGGIIDKFIGDAILVHFGDYDSKGEKEDACACVQMALDMQIRMRELSPYWIEEGFPEPLQIRCGIATGRVAVGNFGSKDRVDYTVIGSPVNLASRLQSKADPGGLLISHQTWALVRERFRTVPLKNIKVKGFNQTFPVYKVSQ